MSMNIVTLLYLVASVFFIQALKGLSHPTTSLRGNLFGMVGMTIAVLTTGALIVETTGGKAQGMVYVLVALVIGGAAGTLMQQHRHTFGLAVGLQASARLRSFRCARP